MISKIFKLILSVISFFFFCFNSLETFCQQDHLINYSIDEGLPSNQVYKIIQDEGGCLWFLTDKGISKYDGYEFKNFTSEDGLSANVILQVQQNNDGTAWLLGMNSSLTRLNLSTNEFQPYEFNDTLTRYANQAMIPKKFIVTDEFLYITYFFYSDYLKISKSGQVLMSPTPATLNWKSNHFLTKENFYYQSDLRLDETDIMIKDSTEDAKSYDLGFFMEDQKVKILTYSNDSIIIKRRNGTIKIHQKNVLEGGVINDTVFWMGSEYGGVKFYSSKTGQVLSHFLDNESVTYMFPDNYDNLWFSTLNSGIFQKQNAFIKQYKFPLHQDKRIHKLEAGISGKLLIAHYNGNISEIKSGRNSSIYQSTLSKPSSIISVNNEIYFSSDAWIFKYSNQAKVTKIINSTARNICEVDNKIGVCSVRGFSFFNESQSFVSHYLDYRVYDALTHNGLNWFATDRGLMYKPNNGDTMVLESSKIFNKRVNTLSEFNHFLVLGTNGEGVIISSNDSVVKKISGSALGSNYINNLYVENDSVLWVCTNSGLTRLAFNDDLSDYTSKTLHQKDGLRSPEVTSVLVLNDTVWIGTKNGLFFMDNQVFDQPYQSKKYGLRIKSISVNDKVTTFAEPVNLPYYQNKLTFHYTAVLFDQPNRTLYRYKLAGLDKQWVYSRNRSVIYPNLSPGNYEFVVQVKGENDSWMENTQTIQVVISPPFWRTWWFISGTIIIACLIMYLFFRLKILLYNRDLVRELLRHLLKRIRKHQPYIIVKEGNREQGCENFLPSY